MKLKRKLTLLIIGVFLLLAVLAFGINKSYRHNLKMAPANKVVVTNQIG